MGAIIIAKNSQGATHIVNMTFHYLIDQLSPKAIYLIGDDLATEEHLKCVEILKARNVPMYYPEGGIAVGERFHFTGNKDECLKDLFVRKMYFFCSFSE